MGLVARVHGLRVVAGEAPALLERVLPRVVLGRLSRAGHRYAGGQHPPPYQRSRLTSIAPTCQAASAYRLLGVMA